MEVDKVAFYFIEEGILNAHIVYKKEGGRKPLLKFKFDCIYHLLAESGVDPAALQASYRFSGHYVFCKFGCLTNRSAI